MVHKNSFFWSFIAVNSDFQAYILIEVGSPKFGGVVVLSVEVEGYYLGGGFGKPKSSLSPEKRANENRIIFAHKTRLAGINALAYLDANGCLDSNRNNQQG